MPLIMMCGFPSSGKTRVAIRLAEFLSSKTEMEVVVVNDESLLLKRNEAYKDSQEEKNTRGLLKEAVDRSLSKDAIVICDSLNYIKGFRYQLYCSARAIATPSCVVWCDFAAEQVRQWNTTEASPRWDLKVLDELIMRFEPPSATRKWENPTFLAAVDREPPFDEILSYLTSKQHHPINLATKPARVADANFQTTLERVTSDIIRIFFQSQNEAQVGTQIPIPAAPGRKILLSRKLTMPELQRLKRTFLSFNRSMTTMSSSRQEGFDYGDQTEAQIASAFADYLNTNMNSDE